MHLLSSFVVLYWILGSILNAYCSFDAVHIYDILLYSVLHWSVTCLIVPILSLHARNSCSYLQKQLYGSQGPKEESIESQGPKKLILEPWSSALLGLELRSPLGPWVVERSNLIIPNLFICGCLFIFNFWDYKFFGKGGYFSMYVIDF